MPPKSSIPLQKVTLNLNAHDVSDLERYYGRGWTEHVRQWVHQHTLQLVRQLGDNDE